MKRFNVMFGIALVGLAATVALSRNARSESDVAVRAASALTVSTPALADAQYVGSDKCKKCHFKEYKSWKETKKYETFEVLMPGKAADVKAKHGLDASKDYTRDESCIKCHVTGYGHEGGYAMPPEGDEKAAKKAKKLAGVGCESCHGPGSAYIDLHEEILKSKREYTRDEMYAAGMWKIEATVCTSCHNEENPTHDAANPFDFEKRKMEGGHEQFELKYRKE